MELKGMTWNHERGYRPLIAASEIFHKEHPEISLSWDKRSLQEFESFPVEELARGYDLIMIDHPFVGTGVHKQVIEPLNGWLSIEFLEDQKVNSAGPSYQSYTWGGRQWALAVDAATQVSAFRKDLLAETDMDCPEKWEDVLAFSKHLPPGRSMGIPLVNTHAYCSFVSICANIDKEFWNEESGIDFTVGRKALDLLKELSQLAHPQSLKMNPIQMLEFMAEKDEILYVPLIFGYSNYAQEGYSKYSIQFSDIPSFSDLPSGGILGGVGMALSAFSTHKREAAAFMEYVASPDFQQRLYVENGGQPGHRKAWEDDLVNQRSGRFYQNTIQTMKHAYVRPRYVGYPEFQDKAGETLHQFLKGKYQTEETLHHIRELDLKCRRQGVLD